jgi:hypothetical protein
MVSVHKTLFSAIDINHEPRGLLGRVLLKGEAAARARSVSLSFASMQDFMAANAANPETWGPTFPGFDPRFNDLSPENSFCILGRDANGEIVATQAGRLYDWTRSNYWKEAESLRLIYANPRSQKLPRERCEVTALAAKGIEGRVFYSGGAWYHPRYRGVGLVEILPRMARALARARWNATCTTTMMVERNVRKGVFPRNGYRNIEWDVRFIDTRIGSIRFALLWIKHEEMLADFDAFLSSFPVEVAEPKSAVAVNAE